MNRQSIPTQWWGFEIVKGCDMAWGCRAIFKPSHGKNCLDILPDRQGRDYPDDKEEVFKAFCGVINVHVLPKVAEIVRHFDPMDREKFVRRFPCPTGPDKLIVAMGSPSGSGGYFYLSVSWVDAAKAPEDVKMPWELYEERRLQQQSPTKSRRKK